MFCEITIDSWIESRKLLDRLKEKGGIRFFRGQGDKNWDLSTRFERDAKKYGCESYFFRNREQHILREFQRRAHHFEQRLPHRDNPVEWLSYLQHYGGSTRLLDFTDSFYVAAFFAMETSVVDSAIWMVNVNRLAKLGLSESYGQLVQRHKEIANSYINSTKEKSEDLVLVVDPFLQHDRLWMQQGLFLFPCNRKSSFEKNLCATFGLPFESLLTSNARKIEMGNLGDVDFIEVAILKISIPKALHSKALLDLRDMNVTPATLFPGLDGFARSLNLLMRELS